jgi:hypothetical protein
MLGTVDVMADGRIAVRFWELEPDGDTGCRLLFTNIVEDRGTAAAVAPGWHAGLDNLAALLDGRPADRATSENYRAAYASVVG